MDELVSVGLFAIRPLPFSYIYQQGVLVVVVERGLGRRRLRQGRLFIRFGFWLGSAAAAAGEERAAHERKRGR